MAAASSEHDLLLSLSAVLRVDQSAAQVAALRQEMRAGGWCWPQLIAFASRELLAPALWVALCDQGLQGDPPAASADYLRRAHAVNAVRNTRIACELEGIIRTLNAVDIEPVLLKGAVDLVAPRYPDPAARIL
ncbi:MAG: nucleotidyltransferase family protein, partial [Salinisphaera sp.]|nr:nucleotidyltransferase family protein [Salinisphaera sp.]